MNKRLYYFEVLTERRLKNTKDFWYKEHSIETFKGQYYHSYKKRPCAIVYDGFLNSYYWSDNKARYRSIINFYDGFSNEGNKKIGYVRTSR